MIEGDTGVFKLCSGISLPLIPDRFVFRLQLIGLFVLQIVHLHLRGALQSVHCQQDLVRWDHWSMVRGYGMRFSCSNDKQQASVRIGPSSTLDPPPVPDQMINTIDHSFAIFAISLLPFPRAY
ncbi:hypothetical protein G7K_6705-t1 [Saitoella complicata NRRL Y-17804]|uniref:Uncharacterized protein n=1 Tax=Saitoella complicata (strain BCRC 22490 / CBS 7301 / JCM 7358 / NBRC 10748 / NRRL Y-17804) TaxID=698492 RepID=A0A0E9NS85_SAICN|nr:hypothetical protein G7K_6705-t1 [Saitoella complicata NRRL Y-17804]